MSTDPVRFAPAAGSRLAWAAAVSTGILALAPASQADNAGDAIAQAFKDGKVNVAFRYRYENVDDDNPSLGNDSASASTLRSRLTYQSGAWNDLNVLLELDDLRTIGADSYNSTRNGETSRPVIADPEATDLNQAFLRYTGIANAELIIGRQKIVRGNERFVGPVGWRQNEQTFDAAAVSYRFNDRLQAYYAFVDQVNRIFGPDEVPAGTPAATAIAQADEYEGDTHLLDVSYTFSPAAKLTAYGYFLDFNEAPAASSQTLGLRLAGDVVLNDRFTLPYAVEYATQDDYAGNPNSYEADYYLIDVGLRWQKITARLAYEVLEGSTAANEAFQTPLATGHAFQGWADKFLTTPTGGIEDTYVVVDFPVLGANVKLRYDDFQAETGSLDYGNEIGLWATLPVGKHYSVSLKYATFDADSESTAASLQDTDKFWVILGANF
jgi:hypothetical protein